MAVLGVVNTFVHSVMYFYYFITAFKPDLKKSIWWKKYITQIQLAQFALLSVFFLRVALAKSCGYSKVFSWIVFIQNLYMLTLFGEFYIQAYVKPKKS